jgi:hypothetical protein
MAPVTDIIILAAGAATTAMAVANLRMAIRLRRLAGDLQVLAARLATETIMDTAEVRAARGRALAQAVRQVKVGPRDAAGVANDQQGEWRR